MRKKDPILIKCIQFCINKGPLGLSYKEFAIYFSKLYKWDISNLSNDQKILIDYYHSDFFVNRYKTGPSVKYGTANSFDGFYSKESLKFHLKSEAEFQFYDYLELKQAIKDSKSANFYARFAIFISFIAIITDIIFRICNPD